MELALTILLWLLAANFLVVGGMKLALPPERLAEQKNMGWVERTDPTRIRIAGTSEVAAALAFVLTALGVLDEWVAGVAAVGIVCLMAIAAIQVHQPAGEPTTINVALGALAAILALLAFTV